MPTTQYEKCLAMKAESDRLIAKVETNQIKSLVLNSEGTLHSKEMLAFYHENPLAVGCPEHIRIAHQKASDERDLPSGVSSLLEPQETTSLKELKGTYRAQFMQGNESEYEATLLAYAEMTDNISQGKYHAFDNCRRFAHFAMDKTSGDVRIMTDSCRQRWCPMCAGQKSKYAKESTQRYTEGLAAPRFLTLTLRGDHGELKPQIEFLQDCFKRLRQRAYWKKNVTGGIWFMQVKRASGTGFWHPHLHILLDGNYMEQGELSELWDQVTFGSPIIDIRRIRDPEESAKYVARYSARPAKLSDLSLDDRIEIILALHGKRLSGTFGNAKAVTLTPPKVEGGGDWQMIDYYDHVVSDSTTNKAAAAVLNAWKTESPLPQWAANVYSKKRETLTITEPERKPVIQLSLDFFNSS